jgi:hypothetical protein
LDLDTFLTDTAFKNVKVSLEPATGSKQDFDFDFTLSKENLGVEGKNLVFKGSAELDGNKLTFEVPLDAIRSKFSLGTQQNTNMGFEAFVFNEDEWVFDVSPSSIHVSGGDLSEDLKQKLATAIREKVEKLKKAVQAGKEEVMPHFPMDVAVPFVGLFYATQFCEQIDFNEEFLDLGFSMKHLNMLTSRQLKLLKNIEGDFYKSTNEKGDKALA